jgi:hypothetical protein
MTQQTIAVQKIPNQAEPYIAKKRGPAKKAKGAIEKKVNTSTQVID